MPPKGSFPPPPRWVLHRTALLCKVVLSAVQMCKEVQQCSVGLQVLRTLHSAKSGRESGWMPSRKGSPYGDSSPVSSKPSAVRLMAGLRRGTKIPTCLVLGCLSRVDQGFSRVHRLRLQRGSGFLMVLDGGIGERGGGDASHVMWVSEQS